VPPLRVKGLEAVGEHGAAQYHAVLVIMGSVPLIIFRSMEPTL
jgi:hypothetical protein